MAEAKTPSSGGSTPAASSGPTAQKTAAMEEAEKRAASPQDPSAPGATPAGDDDDDTPLVTEETRKQWAEDALKREQQSARTRGVDEETVQDYTDNLIYIQSNRLDSRGYQEFDERHPGGYMAIGGDHVDFVYRDTPMVTDLLRQGLAIEVPTPVLFVETVGDDGQKKLARNPYAPAPKPPAMGSVSATQPGQEIVLGRPLSKNLFTTDQRRAVHRQQQRMAQSVAVPQDTIVPPKSDEDRRREERARDQARKARDAAANAE
jgi:hypothetical protein